MMNLVLIGPPGSGKGTQSQKIKEKYGIELIILGDSLRKEVREGTELGLKAKAYMDKGLLVPDNLIVAHIEELFKGKGIDDNKGFVLDGFPRTLNQAKALEELVQRLKIRIDKVIIMNVDDHEILIRLSGRRTCKNCGENYHMLFSPPLRDGICDRCGGNLHQREDDKGETIKSRLEVYQKETEPLISFYQEKEKILEVAGVGAPAEIFLRIDAHIRDLK